MKDESHLIEAARSGDSAAFGQLVTRYQDRLYNTMVHVAGSAEDARDIVQDAFVQAFVKFDTFRGASSFYTWLYRIAMNLAMSHLRRMKPRRSLEADRQQMGAEPVDRAEGPEQPMLRRERVQQVRLALAALPDDHRTILVLREMDGHSYEAIAEILELPIGTVRSRLHRARVHLRDALEPILQKDA